jgi:hypothetical protein
MRRPFRSRGHDDDRRGSYFKLKISRLKYQMAAFPELMASLPISSRSVRSMFEG